jgi:hypothetical protein
VQWSSADDSAKCEGVILREDVSCSLGLTRVGASNREDSFAGGIAEDGQFDCCLGGCGEE